MPASTTAWADATFYGSFRIGVEYEDPDQGEGSWDVRDTLSRWGVRGSEDLGNGTSAIYQLETGFAADRFNGNSYAGRLAWVGLKSGFGAIRVGAQWSPYWLLASGRTDIFNSVFTYRGLYKGPLRLNNAVVFETPDSLANIRGQLMLNMDGPDGKSGIDQYNAAVKIDFGSPGPFDDIGLSFAYLGDEVDDNDLWAVSASVDFANTSIGTLYENYDQDGGGDVYSVTAQYKFGNNIAKAAWSRDEPDRAESRDEWAVGLQHDMSSRTRLFVEYGDLEERSSRFTLGMYHNF